MALYNLALNKGDKAKRLYSEAIESKPARPYLQKSISDLSDFLKLFPEHELANEIRSNLQKVLDERLNSKSGY